MHVDATVVAAVAARFGRPRELRWEWPINADEMTMLRASKRGWRQHDVTLFIAGPDGRVANIRKPYYPPGAWRTPSGGIHPGEDFVAGAQREALEETGLACELQRYLLRLDVLFVHDEQVEPWVSHVFLARTAATELVPRDTREIAGACWLTVAEMQGPIRSALLAAASPLLAYRAALTDATLALWRGGALPNLQNFGATERKGGVAL